MVLENLSQEDIFLLLKWLIVVVIWGLLAIGLYEDRARVRHLQDSSYVGELVHMLYRRNLYTYGLISMVLVVVIADDLNRMAAQKQTAALEKAQEASQLVPVQPQPSEASAAVIPHNSKVPFSDITEFNEANSKQQAYIDLLKQRYETWLITFDYLKKCNKVSDQDLTIIMTSLRKELATAHADSSVEGNITLAADGSYQEMYSNIACDDAHIISTKAGYDATMQRLAPSAVTAAAPAASTPAAAEKPKLAPDASTAAPVTAVTQTVLPQTPTQPAAR